MRRARPSIDVLIVGGGPTGFVVARTLGRAGLRCRVLEAGPGLRRPPPPERARFERAVFPVLAVDEGAWRFRAEGLSAEWMRVRALGGRSLLWGGWCARPGPECFADARAFGVPWPFGLAELAPFLDRAERLLSVRRARRSTYEETLRRELGLRAATRSVAVEPTRRERPMSPLDWALGPNVRVETDVVVRRVIVDAARRVEGVEVVQPSQGRGAPSSVWPARAIVLCASPIESARILLASELGGSAENAGRGLVDHLVASSLALFEGPSPAPRPLEGGVVIPRFVNLPRGVRRRDYQGGFMLEVTGPFSAASLDAETLAALGVGVVEARSLSCVAVHGLGEVTPSKRRFAEPSARLRDALGRPAPVLHLAWGRNERRMGRDLRDAVTAIADVLSPADSRVVLARDPLSQATIIHEAGTCRMGHDGDGSVTDARGAVHGVEGLWVGDASVMPTALDRHPTLTVVALALRTADEIARRFRRDGRGARASR